MSPCSVARALAPTMKQLTGYTASQTCPRITRSLPPAGATGEAQVGAYFPQTGLIALAADLDLTTPWGQSVLLHEMVHAAQHHAHGIPECRAALEYEAYAAQAAYLRLNGQDRDAALLYMFGGLVSTCGEFDPMHP